MVKRVIGCKYKITEGMDDGSSLFSIQNYKCEMQNKLKMRNAK